MAGDLLQDRWARWWEFAGELIPRDLLRVFNLPEPRLLVQRRVATSAAEEPGLRGTGTRRN